VRWKCLPKGQTVSLGICPLKTKGNRSAFAKIMTKSRVSCIFETLYINCGVEFRKKQDVCRSKYSAIYTVCFEFSIMHSTAMPPHKCFTFYVTISFVLLVNVFFCCIKFSFFITLYPAPKYRKEANPILRLGRKTLTWYFKWEVKP